jgi:hypothetical protein
MCISHVQGTYITFITKLEEIPLTKFRKKLYPKVEATVNIYKMRNICLEGVAIFEELILYFRVFATLQNKPN